ncbi:hypothetical protein CVT26_012882, partial [Gymnopilus dilepis]
MKRYQKAVPERNKQTNAHDGFTASLNPVDVAKWEKMCETWEADVFPKSVANPYHIASSNLTQTQVLKELENEERSRSPVEGGPLHEVGPSAFLGTGIALEDTQRRLAWTAKHEDKDAATLTERRAVLRKEIEGWRRLQAIYMPGLMQYLHDEERLKPGSTLDGDNAEGIRLWLPSSLAKDTRRLVCSRGLAEAEERLRTAQCRDALDGICDTLRLKSRMVLFKNKNIRGQREGTRSRTIINRVHDRARKFASRYRAARAAKLSLAGPGEWEKTLQILHDTDVRSYQDPERVKSKKRRRGTWEDSEAQDAVNRVDKDDGEGIDLLPETRTKRDGTGRTRMALSWIWTVR